jgi:biopolymer transport protein ExbD
MRKGGYLLRFVDVVLILLFGFIAISDISEVSTIDLPQSTEMNPLTVSPDVVLYLSITSNGDIIDEEANILLATDQQVEQYILLHKQTYGDLAKVRIRANYDTKAVYAIKIAEICDALEVKKSIEVEVI